MTEQDKQLLLIDLCGRLPYGVILDVDATNWKEPQGHIKVKIECIGTLFKEMLFFNGSYYGNNCKPYLYPMLSMTAEEKEELRQEQIKDEQLFTDCIKNHPEMRGLIIPHFAADWCDKNMFDYRGLISAGLAIEAPEGMYKMEEQQ